MAYGIWAIGGITRHDPGGSARRPPAALRRAGSVLLVAAFLIDPVGLPALLARIYIGLCACSALVLAVGASANGAGRWIAFGSFTFQPSEFGKVLLVLALAAFVADRSKEVVGAGRCR